MTCCFLLFLSLIGEVRSARRAPSTILPPPLKLRRTGRMVPLPRRAGVESDAARLADNELGREFPRYVVEWLAVHDPNEDLCRGPAHLPHRLADGRQPGRYVTREYHVVEADNGKVTSRFAAGFAQDRHRPDRCLVAAGEERDRRLGDREKLRHADPAGGFAVVTFEDQRPRERYAGFGECRLIAGLAVDGREVVERPADMGDATVAESKEMTRGCRRPAGVVDAHGRNRRVERIAA